MDPNLKNTSEGLDNTTMYIDVIIRYLENINKTVESADVRRQINHMRSLFILFRNRVEHEQQRSGQTLTWNDFRKWLLEEEPLKSHDESIPKIYYTEQDD